MKRSESTKTLPVDLMKVVRAKALSNRYLRSALVSLEEHKDIIVDELLWELSVYFFKVDGQAIKVPLNWWEHLKFRWQPRWASERWPVKFKTLIPRAMFLDELPPDKFTKGRVLYYFELPESIDEMSGPYAVSTKRPL